MLCSLYKVLYKKRCHVDRVTAISLALALKIEAEVKNDVEAEAEIEASTNK